MAVCRKNLVLLFQSEIIALARYFPINHDHGQMRRICMYDVLVWWATLLASTTRCTRILRFVGPLVLLARVSPATVESYLVITALVFSWVVILPQE